MKRAKGELSPRKLDKRLRQFEKQQQATQLKEDARWLQGELNNLWRIKDGS